MKRRLYALAGSVVGGVALLHILYGALTGECPCRLRRELQFKLAMLLIRELEWEEFLLASPEEVRD